MSGRTTRRQMKKKKKRGATTKILVILLCIVAVLLGGAGMYLINLQPVNKNAVDEIILVEFEQDENMRNIAAKLKAENVIKSEALLKWRAKGQGVQYIAKPGNYKFSPAMTLDDIIDIIKNGKTAWDFRMIIRDGMDMDEVLADFAGNDPVLVEQYTNQLNNLDYINAQREKFPFLPLEISGDGFRHRLEGFLALGEYQIKEDTTLEEYIDMALERFQKEYTENGLEAKLLEHNKSLFEVVTMASLVRGEVFSEDYENQRKVAGVFYNRIANDMLLQSDVTVGYSLGKKDTNYTMEELENPSPYNTYATPGLPHGPINNPEFKTIEAVLDPIESTYFYFLADICDDGHGVFGEIYYSEDMAQHDAYAREYLACIY